MVLSLIGYTASGKTVIAKELEKLDYKRMVTYTTRNIRPNEIDGFDYHFISKCDFLQKIKEGFFAEFTSYQVYDENGNKDIWYYGSAKESYNTNDNIVIVANCDCYRQLKDSGIKFVNCYIDASKDTVLKRLIKRGGTSEKEYNRRLQADEEDLRKIYDEADIVIDNNGNRDIKEVAKEINEKVKVLSANNLLDKLVAENKKIKIRTPKYREVIYLSHRFGGDESNIKRVEEIVKTLKKEYPDCLFMSPLHAFSYLYFDTDYQQGLDMTLYLLSKCTKMIVTDNYKHSVGVLSEIAYCNKYNIPYEIYDEYKMKQLGLDWE